MPVPRGPSGRPDRPNFRNDAPLSGLEIWLNGTHDELDAALTALDSAGRLVWRSERRRLHGAGDAGRHSVYIRIAVAESARPEPRRRPAPAGDVFDLEIA
ncbi:hypothetical protein Q0Z83_082290 [Actinoplanes sichuanensis]|uniref:Uncharacterized protein n=1 Tax=Actinoplanes sichuanensis TaxID=512349 RepID=A0ABW4AD35_9ACTN|nr:hypothetical protein [Actinoplanes sichuanensis]BEL10038.1 hypothetical protein Q0Z83_082290 [Actinoplanes sichuanensis]